MSDIKRGYLLLEKTVEVMERRRVLWCGVLFSWFASTTLHQFADSEYVQGQRVDRISD